MRLKHLPRTITKFNGKKETTLELQHIKNVLRYDLQLGNLLINALRGEKKKELGLFIDCKNIPF